jgi:hypothetical protein
VRNLTRVGGRPPGPCPCRGPGPGPVPWSVPAVVGSLVGVLLVL